MEQLTTNQEATYAQAVQVDDKRTIGSMRMLFVALAAFFFYAAYIVIDAGSDYTATSGLYWVGLVSLIGLGLACLALERLLVGKLHVPSWLVKTAKFATWLINLAIVMITNDKEQRKQLHRPI